MTKICHPQLTALSLLIVAGTGSRSTCQALRAAFHPLSIRTSKFPATFHGSHCFGNNSRNIVKYSSTTSDSDIMKKRVLIPITDGSEEIETACIQDTLVRFGAEVVIASCKPGGELMCNMSRGLKV